MSGCEIEKERERDRESQKACKMEREWEAEREREREKEREAENAAFATRFHANWNALRGWRRGASGHVRETAGSNLHPHFRSWVGPRSARSYLCPPWYTKCRVRVTSHSFLLHRGFRRGACMAAESVFIHVRSLCLPHAAPLGINKGLPRAAHFLCTCAGVPRS